MNSRSNVIKKTARIGQKIFLTGAVFQIFCLLVFISDILQDIKSGSPHSWYEALGVIALALGAILNYIASKRIMERNNKVENELFITSGEFQKLLEMRFLEWGLTASECDVALLTIKGSSMSEIAQMRASKPGTIKAQSGAIYKKAGVANRAELVSSVIEELIDGLNPKAV